MPSNRLRRRWSSEGAPARWTLHGSSPIAITRARAAFGRSEVNVAHFGERVSHGIVDGSLADLTAFNMCDGNTQGESHSRGGEHLIAVRDQQQQIRPHLPQQVGQGKHSHAQCLCHAHIGIRAEQTLEPGGNGETILLNLFHRLPELGREMCAQHDQLQVDVFVPRQVV